MGLQVKTTEKLTDRVGPNPTFKAKDKESGNHQADEPVSAFRGFPQSGFRVAISATDCLEVTMHAALGKPRSLGKTADTRLTQFSNRVENPNAFSPQCHVVGPRFEGWLKSWWNSAVQSTRSTTICPALDSGPLPRLSLRRDNSELKNIPDLLLNRMQNGVIEFIGAIRVMTDDQRIFMKNLQS